MDVSFRKDSMLKLVVITDFMSLVLKVSHYDKQVIYLTKLEFHAAPKELMLFMIVT